MRYLLLLVLVVVDIAAALPKTDTVKIGSLIPLTGEYAPIGDALRKGMELALAENPNYNLELVLEDGQILNRTAAVKAVNKMISIDKVDAILIDVVNTAPAIAPILNKKQVPGIVIWDSNQKLSSLGEYMFATGYSTELAGEDMAIIARDRFSLEQVAVIANFDEWSEVIAKSFANKFKTLGGKVVLEENVEIHETNLRGIVARIMQRKPDGIYMPLLNQSLVAFVKQLRAAGYQGYLMSGDGFTDADLKALGKQAEGIYSTQVWLSDPRLKELVQERYGNGSDPVNLGFAALGYDAVNMLGQLTQKLRDEGQPVTANTIRDGLIGFSSDGFTGITKIAENRIARKREGVYIVRNGTITPLE